MKLEKSDVKQIEEKSLHLQYRLLKNVTGKKDGSFEADLVCSCKKQCMNKISTKLCYDVCPYEKPYKTFKEPGDNVLGFYAHDLNVDMGLTYFMKEHEGLLRLYVISSKGEIAYRYYLDGKKDPYVKFEHNIKYYVDLSKDETVVAYKCGKRADKEISIMEVFKDLFKARVIAPVFVFDGCEGIDEFLEKHKDIFGSSLFVSLSSHLTPEVLLMRYLMISSLCKSVKKMETSGMELLPGKVSEYLFDANNKQVFLEKVDRINKAFDKDELYPIYESFYRRNSSLQMYFVIAEMHESGVSTRDLEKFFSSSKFIYFNDIPLLSSIEDLISKGYHLEPVTDYIMEQAKECYDSENLVSAMDKVSDRLINYVNIAHEAGITFNMYPVDLRNALDGLNVSLNQKYHQEVDEFILKIKIFMEKEIEKEFSCSKIGKQLFPVFPETEEGVYEMANTNPSSMFGTYYMTGRKFVFEIRNKEEPEMPFIKCFIAGGNRSSFYEDGSKVTDEVIRNFVNQVISSVCVALGKFRKNNSEIPTLRQI